MLVHKKHFFNIIIFCNNVNDFTVTIKQLNAPLLKIKNVLIYFLNHFTDPKLLNGGVVHTVVQQGCSSSRILKLH